MKICWRGTCGIWDPGIVPLVFAGPLKLAAAFFTTELGDGDGDGGGDGDVIGGDGITRIKRLGSIKLSQKEETSEGGELIGLLGARQALAPSLTSSLSLDLSHSHVLTHAHAHTLSLTHSLTHTHTRERESARDS